MIEFIKSHKIGAIITTVATIAVVVLGVALFKNRNKIQIFKQTVSANTLTLKGENEIENDSDSDEEINAEEKEKEKEKEKENRTEN